MGNLVLIQEWVMVGIILLVIGAISLAAYKLYRLFYPVDNSKKDTPEEVAAAREEVVDTLQSAVDSSEGNFVDLLAARQAQLSGGI